MFRYILSILLYTTERLVCLGETTFRMKSRMVPNAIVDRLDGNDRGRVSWKSAWDVLDVLLE